MLAMMLVLVAAEPAAWVVNAAARSAGQRRQAHDGGSAIKLGDRFRPAGAAEDSVADEAGSVDDRISDQGFQRLKDLPGITDLNLYYAEYITDEECPP
jgi:hypothetical protein